VTDLAVAAPTLGAAPILTITVFGEPAAQGSKAYKGHRVSRKTGKRVAILVEQSKRVKPWRELVTAAATEAATAVHGLPLRGPLFFDATFTMRRPQRIPADRLGWPSVKPDGDKLLRAVFDGLTDARIWADDGQVVDYAARKVYPGLHPSALDRPGAYIRIWEVTS
jgi:Holliday junction resolvase RusA-like endonuclease